MSCSMQLDDVVLLSKLLMLAVVSWPIPLITFLKASKRNDCSHCKNESFVSVQQYLLENTVNSNGLVRDLLLFLL